MIHFIPLGLTMKRKPRNPCTSRNGISRSGTLSTKILGFRSEKASKGEDAWFVMCFQVLRVIWDIDILVNIWLLD
jgi:hypothetical protein